MECAEGLDRVAEKHESLLEQEQLEEDKRLAAKLVDEFTQARTHVESGLGDGATHGHLERGVEVDEDRRFCKITLGKESARDEAELVANRAEYRLACEDDDGHLNGRPRDVGRPVDEVGRRELSVAALDVSGVR